MSYPYIIQGENIIVVIDGDPHTINKSHISYNKIVESIKNDEWEVVKEHINPTKVLLNYSQGFLSIINGEMFWKGNPFHNSLGVRIINMYEEGFNITPMVNFMNNLMQNPSKRAVDELYEFLEKNSLPITPDGCFLAYKRVRDDYKDCHTGTMDNSVGSVVSMERNMVDDNRDNTCSVGLHFCSFDYLKSFHGDRTVIVKVNPADVVSIPSDYNNAKGRTCKYEVVGEVNQNPADKVEFNKPVQTNANSVPNSVLFGSSPFYIGYHDGYNGQNFNPRNHFSYDDEIYYDEGWQKGRKHKNENKHERYKLV